jgi:hypothetical protein
MCVYVCTYACIYIYIYIYIYVMYVCRYACVCWCRRGGIYILKSLAPGISPSHPKTKKESCHLSYKMDLLLFCGLQAVKYRKYPTT